MAPKTIDHCCVCGGPTRDSDPVWTVEHPKWAHESCIDWSRRDFPYAWKLKQLRSLARVLVHACRRVFTAGRYLLDTQRTWPRNAREHLAKIKEHESEVSEELRKVRDKLDGR